MTKDQLQAVSNFDELQNDLRFRSLIAHLQSEIPVPETADGQWFKGRISVFEQIASLWAKAPKDPTPPKVHRQYMRETKTRPTLTAT